MRPPCHRHRGAVTARGALTASAVEAVAVRAFRGMNSATESPAAATSRVLDMPGAPQPQVTRTRK
jgi:hypothetical protein